MAAYLRISIILAALNDREDTALTLFLKLPDEAMKFV
jgi:hypothetical protein